IADDDRVIEQVLTHAVDGIVTGLMIGQPVHDLRLGMQAIHFAPAIDCRIIQGDAQLVARSDAIAGILNSHLAGVVPVTESGDDAGEVSCVRPTVPFSHLHIGLVTIPDPVDRGITVVGSRTRGDIRTQIIFNLIVIIGFFPDPQMVELLGTIKSFLGLRRVQVKDDVMFRAVTVFDLANHYRWTAVLLLLLIEAFTGKGTKTGTDKGFTRRYGVRFQKCLVAAGGCNGFDDLLPAPLEKTERDRIRILS